MARRSGGGLTGMSVAQLEAEIQRRGRRVRALKRRRDRVAAKLQRLDQEIMAMGGGGGRGATGRVRPRNATNLADALHKVLKGKVMGVTEVAEAVQRAGYKTTAANFRTIVNQCLISHRKMFKKESRGKYTSI